MSEAIVEINDLTFTYSGSSQPALERINLRVDPGQFITITGASGCGKSTALAWPVYSLCLPRGNERARPHPGQRHQGLSGRRPGRHCGPGPAGSENQLCTLTVKDEVAFGPENYACPPARSGKGSIPPWKRWELGFVGKEGPYPFRRRKTKGGHRCGPGHAACLIDPG